MDWRELEAEIFTATEKALMDLKKAHGDEQFYACVLYTDSSAMTIAFSTNSEEALKAKLDLEDPLERDELESYYKWTSSEWEYEAWGGEYFKNPCRLIRESGERIDISGFKKKIFAIMTSVLGRLRKNEAFQDFKNQNPMLFVTVTDDDGAEKIENETARALNSSLMYEKFSKRFDG